MATLTITRGTTLPDAGVKADLHNLIDTATVAISSIVNADVSATAAIAGTKISPNFGSQTVQTAGDAEVGTLTINSSTEVNGVLDEDDMASDSATKLSTQQSIKAYVDSNSRVSKAWARYNGATDTLVGSFNVSGVVKNGTGDYTISWGTDFAAADYAVVVTSSGYVTYITAADVGSINILVKNAAGAAADPAIVCAVAFGDQ